MSIKEFINFLSYAKGSAGELKTQAYIGMDIGYIDKEIGMKWIRFHLFSDRVDSEVVRFVGQERCRPKRPGSVAVSTGTASYQTGL